MATLPHGGPLKRVLPDNLLIWPYTQHWPSCNWGSCIWHCKTLPASRLPAVQTCNALHGYPEPSSVCAYLEATCTMTERGEQR